MIYKEPTAAEWRKEAHLQMKKELRRIREKRRFSSPYIKKDRQISAEMREAAIERKKESLFSGKTPESVKGRYSKRE